MLMMKKLMIAAAAALLALTMQAQESNKYIVKTKGAVKTVVAEQPAEGQTEEKAKEEPQDLLSRYFHYVSLCDWKEGMRFMVIPDKKDLVIKTFADAATGQMVSSRSLRHKIMVYKGHENTGGLHEHINFVCEDDGKAYYFEVPTLSFDDYCYGKLGVPTLAYLGDVDTAIELFKDKVLFTTADEYYVDTELDGDGYKTIFDVPDGTEVKVVAVGVGTRSFPVKIIVADSNGREFYQNVAISRTNSGMRDDEFDISNMKFHTFKGAFELPDDSLAASGGYRKYVGKTVFTLYNTEMIGQNGQRTRVARLSTFVIKDVKPQRGSHYVKMTLKGESTGRTYTKEVTFVSQNVAGDIAGQREDLFDNLFAWGNPLTLPGVRQANFADVQKSIVRAGFTEGEVKLALGEPTGHGEDGRVYTWVYNEPGRPYVRVTFDKATNKVKNITRQK